MRNFENISRSRRLAALGALAAIGLAAAWLPGRAENPGPIGFRLDDAWIHLVYGRGLLRDGFLAYAPGIPSTGCTSPLWAIILAALHGGLGGSPPAGTIVSAVLATGAALQVAVTMVAGSLARRLAGSDAAGLAGGALVALAMPWTAAAFSGMEVTATGLLLLLGVRSAAGGAWGVAGVWMALAGLARPEAAAVTIALAAGSGWWAGAAHRLPRLLGPSLIAGAAFVGYDLWASGAPLPATFYAKSSASIMVLPMRVVTAMTRLLAGVPPLAGGIGWLALAGFLPFGRLRKKGAGRNASDWPAAGAPVAVAVALLPLQAGIVYLLANLLLIDPIDPAAFYHLRYVLPAVPLLLVGLAVGAHRLGARARGRSSTIPVPLLVLVALSIGEAMWVAGPVSRHLHNDVRNINEVQRAIGEHLGATLPPGTPIAASDAGAIRYFSDLPTIDVIGLNTPEMLEFDERFVSEHPVAMLAILPAWFRSHEADRLEATFEARTERYTVTGNPSMAAQVVLRAKGSASVDGDGGSRAARSGPVRARFVGFHRFELDFLPSEAMLSSPGRDAP